MNTDKGSDEGERRDRQKKLHRERRGKPENTEKTAEILHPRLRAQDDGTRSDRAEELVSNQPMRATTTVMSSACSAVPAHCSAAAIRFSAIGWGWRLRWRRTSSRRRVTPNSSP